MVAVVIGGRLHLLGRSRVTRPGLPILLGLSLVGFTAAVGVARLIASSEGVRRLFDRRQAMKSEEDDDE